LQTNTTQKVSLSIIFLLGSFVVFTSIYRFTVYLNYDPNDLPYTLALGKNKSPISCPSELREVLQAESVPRLLNLLQWPQRSKTNNAIRLCLEYCRIEQWDHISLFTNSSETRFFSWRKII
jgi:hypothetical protein